MKAENVIILGAGLAGLSLAYRLQDKGISYQILEARERIGGRIHTLYQENRAPVEMGATWIDLNQRRMIQLLKSLHLEIFEQKLGKTAIYEQISTSPAQIVQLPPNSIPSYRIKNGSSALINALAEKLDTKAIYLNTVCEAIDFSEDLLQVQSSNGIFSGTHIVNTIPPYLFQKSIDFKPALPSDLDECLKRSYTWMGDSIKVSFRYDEKFWESGHLSGTIFSNVGPINEMYDQSDSNAVFYALTGFMSGAFFSVTKEERKSLLLRQLARYYGEKVYSFLSYHETVWAKESFTYARYEHHLLPKQNNGHELFQFAYYNKRLFFAGAEIGRVAHGHMEAALESVERVIEQITE